MAIETFGPVNEAALNFITDIGRRTSLITEEKREISFLRQRISMTLQRFNAVCLRGSFTAVDDAVDAEEINPYIHDSSTSTSQESNPSYDVFSSIPNDRTKQNAADNIENGYISAGNE